MRLTIELDTQPSGWAVEVHDVRTVAVLSAELESVELALSEMDPEQLFRRRACTPECVFGTQAWRRCGVACGGASAMCGCCVALLPRF